MNIDDLIIETKKMGFEKENNVCYRFLSSKYSFYLRDSYSVFVSFPVYSEMSCCTALNYFKSIVYVI